jgi:CheY-like chemotaxis protein
VVGEDVRLEPNQHMSRRILVVEDGHPVMDTNLRVLTRAGYTVAVVPGVDEARADAPRSFLHSITRWRDRVPRALRMATRPSLATNPRAHAPVAPRASRRPHQ